MHFHTKLDTHKHKITAKIPCKTEARGHKHSQTTKLQAIFLTKLKHMSIDTHKDKIIGNIPCKTKAHGRRHSQRQNYIGNIPWKTKAQFDATDFYLLNLV